MVLCYVIHKTERSIFKQELTRAHESEACNRVRYFPAMSFPAVHRFRMFSWHAHRMKLPQARDTILKTEQKY